MKFDLREVKMNLHRWKCSLNELTKHLVELIWVYNNYLTVDRM